MLFLDLLKNIWNDIVNFLAGITGRTVVAQAGAATATTAPATPTIKPGRITLTPLQAAAKARATEGPINPRDGNEPGWLALSDRHWVEPIVTRHAIYIDMNSECGGQAAPNLTFQEASSAGLAAGGIAAKLAPSAIGGPIGLVTLGAGFIIGALTKIFTHHAQAVARDLKAICTLVPAANNALDVIINGVQNGTISPQDGITAMQQLPQIFVQQAGPAKNNHPYCNAVCEQLIVLRAICFYWESQFEAMI